MQFLREHCLNNCLKIELNQTDVAACIEPVFTGNLMHVQNVNSICPVVVLTDNVKGKRLELAHQIAIRF